ncbi:hypothetical protein FBU59_000115 [Linderina macrospora]|uniref:Uncharacterized protein n=1 Tax=Linderina macrospora TaxID=4868 RepID=A0ACC1JHL0_9FUNG|nr:hypothetical protein FBU59_000115 [Linderina macrospora]
MKVPFFRSKNTRSSNQRGTTALDNIASESGESSPYSSGPSTSSANLSMPTLPRYANTAAAPNTISNSNGSIVAQLAEMEEFLGKITDFQGEARRLFPENVALDQILSELQDECQRRVEYISRVSAPPAWMSHQRTSSTSSTIFGHGGGVGAMSTPNMAAARLQPAGAGSVRGRGAISAPGVEMSPASSSTVTSTNSHRSRGDSAGGSSDGSGKGAGNFFSRHGHSKHTGEGKPSKRDPRVSENRRQATTMSMFVSKTSPAGIDGGSGMKPSSSRLNGAGSNGKSVRGSAGNPLADSPQRPRSGTSSADLFRPLSLAGVVDSGGPALATKSSLNVVRTANGGGALGSSALESKQQAHAVPTKAGNEYAVTLKLAGRKIDAAVSSSLQASLVSLAFATQMGVMIQRMPHHTRVWDRRGTSWPVVGKVIGLPFVCGNMSFTHDFQVVQPGVEMPRDLVLGNDFCVGNKGHIKDNRLHLEQLCTTVTVPVRQISAR